MGIITSSFDLYLLITDQAGEDGFGIVGIQTDDILILLTAIFSAKEEEKLKETKFRIKLKIILTKNTSLDFNGARLCYDGNGLFLLL